jgi:hypothetical protein
VRDIFLRYGGFGEEHEIVRKPRFGRPAEIENHFHQRF